MTVLLDRTIGRTLDALLARFADDAARGTRIEAWLFEDLPARQAAEARFAVHGVQARIRSAYKPLVHFFLEETEQKPDSVIVYLPSHPAGSERRFRIEAFPLAGLLKGAALRFAPGDAALEYRIVLTEDGETSERRIFAPNRVTRDHLGETVLVPTGWLRVWRTGGDGAPDEDAALPTEYEAAFEAAMSCVLAHPWPATQPCFDVLAIEIETPGIERRLPFHDECASTAEGLHEDLYFSLIEFFQRHAGLALGDRTLQPGQIVPEIRTRDGDAQVRVALRNPLPDIADGAGNRIEDADTPPDPSRIDAALAELGGAPIRAVSRQGRDVVGRFLAGAGRGFVVTAGQHANETTGVVGALRAAPLLKRDGALFAVIPQENPDGYALHRRLRETNSRHMHHAARYTALGDDLQYRTREPLYEKAARLEAYRLTEAGLHINLHGYPAHEWNRPLTGYLTRGFDTWSMPKGFYLILRHPTGRHDAAVSFLEALTERLAQIPGLRAFNDSHVAAYTAHAGAPPEPVLHGIPCMIHETDDRAVPYTLITEYPDETIYGDAYRLGHTAQMATILEAVALYRGGMLP